MKMFLAIVLFASMSFAQLVPQTPAQLQVVQSKQQLRQIINSGSTGLNQVFKSIWNNKNPALTPCVMWAAWGVNAVLLRTTYQQFGPRFAALSPLVTVLAEPTPDVGTIITNNMDGTVSCQ